MLIVCVGMLRSGSTLQYNIARALVEKMDRGIGEGFFTKEELSKIADKLSAWRKDESLHVVKTHAFDSNFAEMSPEKTLAFLYIYRDIRDVAVSIKNKFRHEGDQLIRSLDSALKTFDELRDVQQILWQKYEHVVSNLPGAVQQTAEFLQISPADSVVKEIAEECAIEKALEITTVLNKSFYSKMASVFRRLRFPINSYDKTSLFHPDHISHNRGEIGVWRKELSEQEVELITNRYAHWLEERGYLS